MFANFWLGLSTFECVAHGHFNMTIAITVGNCDSGFWTGSTLL
jgi:hypothetical protein